MLGQKFTHLLLLLSFLTKSVQTGHLLTGAIHKHEHIPTLVLAANLVL